MVENLGEDESCRLITRITVTMDDGAVDASNAEEDHAEAANKWCHTPNLVESDKGKFTSPRECSWYCTNIGEDNVAAILSSIVAFIGILLDTVCTVGAFRFSNHIVEQYLKLSNKF